MRCLSKCINWIRISARLARPFGPRFRLLLALEKWHWNYKRANEKTERAAKWRRIKLWVSEDEMGLFIQYDDGASGTSEGRVNFALLPYLHTKLEKQCAFQGTVSKQFGSNIYSSLRDEVENATGPQGETSTWTHTCVREKIHSSTRRTRVHYYRQRDCRKKSLN